MISIYVFLHAWFSIRVSSMETPELFPIKDFLTGYRPLLQVCAKKKNDLVWRNFNDRSLEFQSLICLFSLFFLIKRGGDVRYGVH